MTPGIYDFKVHDHGVAMIVEGWSARGRQFMLDRYGAAFTSIHPSRISAFTQPRIAAGYTFKF